MKFIFGTSGAGRKLRKALSRIEGILQTSMATQAELAEQLRQLKAQQNKIAKEQSDRFDALTAKIAALEAAIANAPVTAEVENALTELKAATQALDDTIPDAPVEPATEAQA